MRCRVPTQPGYSDRSGKGKCFTESEKKVMSTIGVNDIDEQGIRRIETNHWIGVFEVRSSRIES